MTVNTHPFGADKYGEAVTAWTLANNNGASVEILDYGATVRSLIVPDAEGRARDVALGYGTLAEYEANGGYMGATLGRVANRIAGARFSLGGREYSLYKNDGDNALHGGRRGFDKRVWQAGYDGGALRFTLRSPDGEEGYPGSVTVTLEVTLTEENALVLHYTAGSDAMTPLSLTNHTYFNLDGSRVIDGHVLKINASRFCEAQPDGLPTGRFLGVAGTPFDFRAGRTLGEAFSMEHPQTALFGGIDHNFVLDGMDAAWLYSPVSGIAMAVTTTLPGMQLYTGNGFAARPGKGGAEYGEHCGLCLETQVFPDGMNHYGFPSPVLRPGEKYESETVFSFSAVK